MIDRIETAIIERVRALSTAGVLGYRYKTLETYPVDWDEYIEEKGAGLPAPAAWCTFAGWRQRDGEDPRGFNVVATFGLVVMAQNLRNETATRHGGPDRSREPGSFQLAVDAAVLLHGQDFDLPIDSISIGALRIVPRLPAWKERKVSMLALELITGFRVNALSEGGQAQLADFQTFHANWDIKPFGNVDADDDEEGRQIPADETADATDHVTLETEAP
jgi:phage gp37-like protein